jgi:hypothetical protein
MCSAGLADELRRHEKSLSFSDIPKQNKIHRRDVDVVFVTSARKWFIKASRKSFRGLLRARNIPGSSRISKRNSEGVE